MGACTLPPSTGAATAAAPLTSTGAPWPGADAWRPAGWRTGLTPAEVVDALARLARGEPVPGVDPAAAKADGAFLRDCWSTPAWVWEIAAEVIGPPAVDPFWNPWSCIGERWSGVRLLDGRDGRNGFDPTLWGTGPAFINGPHSDNSRTMSCASAHVRAGNPAAVVAPLDGCDWVQGATVAAEGGPLVADFVSADLIVLLGRLRFVPPPGVSDSSPRGAYQMGLWGVPEAIGDDLAGTRLWVPEAGREVVILRGAGDHGFRASPEREKARAARSVRRPRSDAA